MRETPLAPGTFVTYGGYDGEAPECGIIVQCWWDVQMQGYDCYVAFYGEAFPGPDEPLVELPYVLRFFASSLRVVSPAQHLDS